MNRFVRSQRGYDNLGEVFGYLDWVVVCVTNSQLSGEYRWEDP